jgi:hypothetical protein
VAEHFPHANRSSFRVKKENGLDSGIEGESKRTPKFTRFDRRCGVLDGCSQRRNQAPHQN